MMVPPPVGYAYAVTTSGAYIIDASGRYVIVPYGTGPIVVPPPPLGYEYLLGADGSYLQGPDGLFLLGPFTGVASVYLLLVPHYLVSGLVGAGTVVVEGRDVPAGWVPTKAVDPQNSQAVQAFWNAGPPAGAEPNQNFYPWVPAYRKPLVYWVWVGNGQYQLTGAGASLGPKGA